MYIYVYIYNTYIYFIRHLRACSPNIEREYKCVATNNTRGYLPTPGGQGQKCSYICSRYFATKNQVLTDKFNYHCFTTE